MFLFYFFKYYIKTFIKIRKYVEDLIEEKKEHKLKSLTLDYVEQKIIDDIPFGFTTNSGEVFLKLKEDLYKDGILSYRDAYDLGLRYIKNYPSLSSKQYFSRNS